MKQRVFWLFVMLTLRCILGWISTFGYATGKQIMVVGNISYLYRTNSECIIVVGQFLIRSENICAESLGTEIKAFGSLERRLIDSFGGRLWLVAKQIDKLERTQELKESRTQDKGLFDNFREKLVLVYKKFVPEPEAGLIAGIVLGYKKDIGLVFYDLMIKSGAVHIAVASGYNILLVGSVVLAVSFWLVKRQKAIWVAILAMIFYAFLAGGEPPVVRAVWMAGLMYVGQAMGRGNASSWILTLTAWIMLMIDPTLMVSASFQLSVAASYGLIVIEPWLVRYLEGKVESSLVEMVENTGILTTGSTMIATLPIIWWHFGRMSLIGIVSNILILPFVPPLMILGVGMLMLPSIFAWPTYALAHWVVLVIKFFGS